MKVDGKRISTCKFNRLVSTQCRINSSKNKVGKMLFLADKQTNRNMII